MAKIDNKWLLPLFEANPESKELYAVDKTGTAFYRENDAHNHASEQGTEYRKVTREEAEKDEAPQTDVPSEKWTVEKLKEYAKSVGVAFDEKLTKAQLVELIMKSANITTNN